MRGCDGASVPSVPSVPSHARLRGETVPRDRIAWRCARNRRRGARTGTPTTSSSSTSSSSSCCYTTTTTTALSLLLLAGLSCAPSTPTPPQRSLGLGLGVRAHPSLRRTLSRPWGRVVQDLLVCEASRRRRVFEQGQGVVIRGLSNSTKYNERTGSVKQVTKEGVLVELRGHPKPLLIKPANLKKCQRWLDTRTHEVNPNISYPAPPEYLDVVYSAVILKPGLSTPAMPPGKNSVNAPPERFWVSQVAAGENSIFVGGGGGGRSRPAAADDEVDLFFSGYNRLTIHGQAQCGRTGVEMRDRFAEGLELLPPVLKGANPTVSARAAPGDVHRKTVEAFTLGLLTPECDPPRVVTESPFAGLAAPMGNECPRLMQLRADFDNETLPKYPQLHNLVHTRVRPSGVKSIDSEGDDDGLGPSARQAVPAPLAKRRALSGAVLDGTPPVLGLGEEAWSATLGEIRSHFLYGLPMPWNLNEDAIEVMHRHRLNLTRKALLSDEYRRLVAGPMLHTITQEIAEVLFYGLERNVTVYGVDEFVFNALVASFGRRLRAGWPPDGSHIVIEIARDARKNTRASNNMHVVRILYNNQEFAMGNNTAWISFQEFIQRISFDVLKPEKFPEACAYQDPMKNQPSEDEPGNVENISSETMEHMALRKWLEDAGTPHLFVKFLSRGIHNPNDARKMVMRDIREVSEEMGLEIGERLSLQLHAQREWEQQEALLRKQRNFSDEGGVELPNVF